VRKSATKEQFLERAIKIHGDKFEYDLTSFLCNTSRIDIICKKHGIFSQVAQEHLRGCGCKACAIETTTNILVDRARAKFASQANKMHQNKYCYDNVIYINRKSNVEIICPEHGKFMQTPSSHLRGSGCQKCASISISNLLSRDLLK
jgi:hypothetical protein